MDTLDLDVGYRFYPTNQEIILFLEKKRLDPSFSVHTILEANITDYEPNQLFELPAIRFDEKWCNFFSPSKYVNGNGDRARSTGTGYWKSTGKILEIKAKRSNRVIGHKRFLVFHERHGSIEIKTDNVMHEYTIGDNPLFKKDFALCRIKKKRDKKRRLSTKNEGRRTKKPRAEAKKPCAKAKKSRADGRVKKSRADRVTKKSRVDSINDKRQLSHNVTYDNENYVAENIFSESYLLSSCNSISNSRNHVAENISLQSQLISSCDSISNRNQVAETPEYNSQVDTLTGSSGLDQTSFCAPLSPVQPVQGSSYSGVSADVYDVSEAPIGIEWDDIFVVQLCPVPDEYPREEAENTTPLEFSSSKSAEGSGGGNGRDMDTDAFNDWVSSLFGNNSSEACLDVLED